MITRVRITNLIDPLRRVEAPGGNGTIIEPDPDKRPYYEQIAQMLVEGVSWRKLADAVGESDGRPTDASALHRIFYHPTFWGNMGSGRVTRSKVAPTWMWDASARRPKGVVIEYDTHEPVIKGKLAVALKQELTRRAHDVRGGRAPIAKHAFSSICSCGECGYKLAVYMLSNSTNYRCFSKWRDNRPDCSQHAAPIAEDDVKRYLDTHIVKPLQRDVPLMRLINTTHEPSDIVAMEEQITVTKEQIRNLAERLAMVNKVVAPFVAEQANALGEQLKTLEQERGKLMDDQMQITALQREAAGRIAKTRNFWNRSVSEINRDLMDVLGRYKVVVMNGEIVGLSPYDPEA